MQTLSQPKFLIPLFTGLILLSGLLAFGGIGSIAQAVTHFNPNGVPLIVFLMLGYEYVRGRQWTFFLHALHIPSEDKDAWLAFFIGESAKDIPLGNYVQTVLLHVLNGENIGALSAIATFIVIIEVFISLAGLVIIGLGDWSSWLRPVIIIGSTLFFLGWYTVARLQLHIPLPQKIRKSEQSKRFLAEWQAFKTTATDLLHPTTLIPATALSACYIIISAGMLHGILLGLGVTQLLFWQTLACYFFSLAFALIVPVPVDIGVMEIGGSAAFLALGLSKRTAISTMLLYRFFNLLIPILIAACFSLLWKDRIERLHQSDH